ncbi:hypothetical protein T492DRAFT_970503 [Pavlovales sp. CCMP2436]|nr:hypothetical protein T492DRAFT_970503 [Pavlovales sp. CCMP2436]
MGTQCASAGRLRGLCLQTPASATARSPLGMACLPLGLGPRLLAPAAFKRALSSAGGGVPPQVRRSPIGWYSLALTSLSAAGLYAMYRKRLDIKVRNVKVVGQAALGGPFALLDVDGKTVTDESLHGKWVLLYFGFTKCPDICPDELEKLSDVTRRLDAAGLSPPAVPVFITIDPGRDSVARLKAYFGAPEQPPSVAAAAAAARAAATGLGLAAAPSAAPGGSGSADDETTHGFAYHPRLVALTGEPAEIDAVCRAYRIYTSKPSPAEVKSGDYLLDHSIIIYVIAPDGKFVSFYGRNWSASEVASKALAEIQQWKADNGEQSLFERLMAVVEAAVGLV